MNENDEAFETFDFAVYSHGIITRGNGGGPCSEFNYTNPIVKETMLGMILAGGGGTRLWPFSRHMSPKQFLNIGTSHESLLQETVKRISSLISHKSIYIVGSSPHEYELIHQMKQVSADFPQDNILLEPMSKNTAPAILWGLLNIPEARRKEPIVILPADHLIPNAEHFIHHLKEGQKLATDNWLLTFGVKPDNPDTGLGYIKSGKALDIGFQVEQFVEKPDQALAEKYVESDQYTWNSGIFMSTPENLLEEFKNLAPDIYNAFNDHVSKGVDWTDKELITEIYNSVVGDSIDYAILEKSERVAVLPFDVKWSDLGSWESIHRVSQKDENNNVTRGNVILQDTKNSLIFSGKKLVASIGVENLIIVETDDAILVCDLRRSQDVKKLVDTLKQEDRHEYKFHTTVVRSWGRSTVLYETPGYNIKTVEIFPGKFLTKQRHQHRSEHWIVLQGTADVIRGDEQLFLTENESTYIPKTMIHRLGNSGRVPLHVMEIQLGEYIDDDDIERFYDPVE